MKYPEQYRIHTGKMGSQPGDKGGCFKITRLDKIGRKRNFFVIASEGEGWDHVSVSPAKLKRAPSWNEMCFIKALFWDENEAVMQLHPPRKDYVNNHEFCLHLWRPQNEEIPLPDSLLVGIKNLEL